MFYSIICLTQPRVAVEENLRKNYNHEQAAAGFEPATSRMTGGHATRVAVELNRLKEA
jgi:hypothetical protein